LYASVPALRSRLAAGRGRDRRRLLGQPLAETGGIAHAGVDPPLPRPGLLGAQQHFQSKLLRDALRGSNPKASAQEFAQWVKDSAGAPNAYCSGNVFELPLGRTTEEEVTLRRHLAKQVVSIITEADTLKGAQRDAFVKEKMEALQQEVLARRQA